MIRNILSQLVTDAANQSMPNALGDAWKSEQFTVLFQPQLWKQAVNADDDEYWDAIAKLSGTALVRVYADEQHPLDLTPLMIDLFTPPIPCRYSPDPALFAEGEFSVRLHWKPTEITDMMWENGIVPVLKGDLSHCYVLRRNATPHPASTQSDYEVLFGMSNHQPDIGQI